MGRYFSQNVLSPPFFFQTCINYRYEIREDRLRETKVAETRLESLQGELLHAIKTYHPDDHKNRPPPYGYTSGSGQLSTTQQHFDYVRTVQTQAPSDCSTITAQNDDPLYISNNRDHYLYRFSHPGLGQRPSNYTVAKVANYISHLGDSFSSQMTDTFPSNHNISDQPSPAHDSDAHVQFSNGCSPSYSLVRPHATRTENNDESVAKPEVKIQKLLTQKDIESVKLEILCALKAEIRDSAKEVASDIMNMSGSGTILPDLSSELYQTHLYTQL